MSTWAVPPPADPPPGPNLEPADEPVAVADEATDEPVGADRVEPWWSRPAEPDPDAMPTMAQLDALGAALDEIDAALAAMDDRAGIIVGPDRRGD